MKRSKGFTLIELLVAVAIFSIGTVAAYRTFDQAQRGIGGQIDRTLATEVALNRAAELRITGMREGRNLPSIVRQGRVDWRVEVRERGTSGGFVRADVIVSAPDRPGAMMVVHVPTGGI